MIKGLTTVTNHCKWLLEYLTFSCQLFSNARSEQVSYEVQTLSNIC